MKIFFVISFLFFSFLSYNQELPAFMLEIQKEKPNFFTVEKLYKEYAEEYKEKNPKSIDLENQEREEFKNPYEKQYIEWIRLNKQYINEQGFIIKPSPQEFQKEFNRSARQARAVNATTQASYNSDIPYHTTFDGWSYEGPVDIKDINVNINKNIPQTANIRAFAQSKSNPNFLYSAVEAGPLFLSRDKGNTWHYATKGYTGMDEITAIGVSPINEYYAYVGNANGIFATKDGGVTWQLMNDNTYNSSIILHTGYIEGSGVVTKIVAQNTNSNPEQDFVLIATQKGLFKITNNGTSYSFRKVVNFFTTDIIKKPGSSTIFYSLVYEQSTNHLYFYESTDSGDTWHKKGDKNGWYDPTTSIPIEKFQGGRLAVTDINPEVVYAYVIEGRQGKNDNNFLGVYKSSDSGSSWTLPNTNGPGEGANGYNDNNKNLASFPWDYYIYSQGFYNCTIMVNPNNENEIILGGLNIYKSTDGAKTFSQLGGHKGPFVLHPDSQTFYTQKNNDNSLDVWITTDGGINYSNDFFSNIQNHQIKNRGLSGDYWGFDVGEKTGNYIGGSYHNGNKYYHENYPRGSNKFIGGVEEATGYILSGNDERHMSTFHGSIIAPLIDGNLTDYNRITLVLNPIPTEEISPISYNNKDYLGYFYYMANSRKQIYKNSGKVNEYNSTLLSNVPNNETAYCYVVDFYNPNVQYLYTVNSKFYVSNDSGQTWINKTSPFNSSPDVYLAIDGVNPNKIYALRRYSDSGFLKASIDQGQTWININTPQIISGTTYEHIQTVRGLSNTYFLTTEKNSKGNYSKIYYFYDNKWNDFSENLPSTMNILKLKINVTKGRLYLPTQGYGIWTSNLPTEILETIKKINLNIGVDIKRTDNPNYNFNFNDKSKIIGMNIVKFSWKFPGAKIITGDNTMSPIVEYNKIGKFSVALELTDDKGQSYKEIFPNYISIFPSCDCSLPKGIINNIKNIQVWFDANDFENGQIKDKISKEIYDILPSQDITIETASEFNNQKVFNIKAGSITANILLNKIVEGKTLFIVNSLHSNSTSNFSFLFGNASSKDFHSEKNTLFSNSLMTDKTRFDFNNGGVTQINGIQTDYFITAQKTVPTLYSIRTANGKIGAEVSSISRDRNYANRNWQGKIAEVLIFDKQLTDAEVQDINKYLMDKYNIK